MSKIKRIKRWIKHTYQKWRYGFSDDELWSFDHTIANYLVPRLKRFNKINIGYPAHDLEIPGKELTMGEWQMIVKKMIYAFELMASDDYFGVHTEEQRKDIEQGLKLFTLYFSNLWI